MLFINIQFLGKSHLNVFINLRFCLANILYIYIYCSSYDQCSEPSLIHLYWWVHKISYCGLWVV